MHRRLAPDAGDGGFILLESIVAMAVVTIVVAALSALFVSTSQTTSHLRIRQAAIQLADSGIDTVRAYAPGGVQTDRVQTTDNQKSVEDQYLTGVASTAPSALSTALGAMADPLPGAGSGTVAPQPTIPAVCPPPPATTPYLPITPVCLAVGSRAFVMSYYLGNCYIVNTGSTACVSAKPPTAGGPLTYVRAVVAVRWTNDHCSGSSCVYVTSTLINNTVDPTFDINHGGASAPVIIAPNLISDVGDTGPFAAPTLRTGTGVAPFTWGATGLPVGLTMTTDGTVKGTIAPQVGGTNVYIVHLTVVDGLINRQLGSFNWTVRQPTIASPGNQSTVINTPVSLPVAATCWKSPCVYALINGPAWATINSATGVITGTPTVVGTASSITVTISDGHTPAVTATTDPFDWVVVPVPAAVCVTDIALTNGSFEDPNTPFVLRGAPNWMVGGQAPLLWNTTEPDNVIELWKNDNASGSSLPLTAQAANGGQPISAEDGTQWAELNANATGALYQNLTTTPGVTLQWSVWHRGRYSAGIGTKQDVMRVQIGSTTVQQDQAATNVATGVTAADISDDWTAWHLYRGFYVVPAGQTTTRFQFAAISTASGDNSIGNFIDNLSLNNRVACVQQLPDPQTSTVGVAINPLQLSAIRGSGNFQWAGAATLPAGLSMTTAGLISGTPTTVGARSVVLTLTDTQTTYTTNVPFTWTVVARPTITAPSAQTTSVGGVVSLQVTSTCPNKPCTYALANGPSGLAVSTSGLITGAETSSAQTFSATTITVRDSAGVTATTAAFTWRVVGGPIITSPGDQKTLRGATVSLDMSSRASGGIGSYLYASTSLPPWLSINRTTGLITGVAPSSQESTTVGITITVTDGMNASSSTAPFNWIVYSAPVVTAPANQASVIGATVSVAVGFTCGNPPCTFTMAGQPNGLSINNSGVITGTVGGLPQIYSNVRVTITDAAGASARSSAFTWTVSFPPLQASQVDLVSTVNTAIAPLQLIASGGSGSSSWSGSPPAGLTMTADGRVSGSPSSLRSGPVTLTVTDTVTGNVVPVTFNWAVVAKPTVAAPANQVTSVGASVNLTVPGLTCPNSPCTVILTNGPPGLGIIGGVITGTVGGPPATFANVTITVTDAAGGLAASSPFTWTVKAAPTITPANQTTTVGAVVNYPPPATCANTPCGYLLTGQPAGLTINAGTGAITGTVSGAPQVYANVVVRITDAAGVSVASTFTWTVKAPPTVTPVIQTSTVGAVVTYLPASTCPNTPCTFTMTGAPTGLSINNAGIVTGTVGGAAQTYASVIVTITDAAGVSVASSAFSWVVKVPPTVTAPSSQTSTVGRTVSLTLASTCPTTPCTFTMTGGPTGLSINSSAVISGTVGGVAQTYASVIVTITDAAGVSVASSAFTWIVKAASTVTPVNQTTTLGATVNVAIPSTCSSAPCTFTMTGAPTGLSINNSGIVTGTVGGAAQVYASVIVTITDVNSVSVASSPFTWTVRAAPTITPLNQTTTVGGFVNYPPAATCANAPCGYLLTGQPAGLTINAGTGAITGTVSGTPQVYANVVVRITDAAGVSVASTFTWTVKAQPTMANPGNQAVHGGAASTLAASSVESGGSPSLTYSATGLPSWLTINAATGLISGTAPSIRSITSGITVTVVDAYGFSATSPAFKWVVAYPSIAIPNQVTGWFANASIDLDNYTSGGTGPYTFTIVNKPTWLTYNSTSHVLSGTGPFSFGTTTGITVSVTDSAGSVVTSAPFTWQTAFSTSLVWSTIPDQSSLPDVAATALNVTVLATNDRANYGAVGLPPGLTMNVTTGVISGTPTLSGDYQVAVSATDSSGNSVPSAPFTWHVTNLAWSTIPAQTSPRNVADTLDVTPFDTGGIPALTYAVSGLPATLTMNASTGLISGTPTVSGTYSVTVTVTDLSAASATSTAFSWVVS